MTVGVSVGGTGVGTRVAVAVGTGVSVDVGVGDACGAITNGDSGEHATTIMRIRPIHSQLQGLNLRGLGLALQRLMRALPTLLNWSENICRFLGFCLT